MTFRLPWLFLTYLYYTYVRNYVHRFTHSIGDVGDCGQIADDFTVSEAGHHLTRLRGYFMLNSAELEIYPAHKC